MEEKLNFIRRSVRIYNKIKFLTTLYDFINKLIYKITYFSNSNNNKKTIVFQNRKALYRSMIKDGSDEYNLVVLGDMLISLYYFISSILITKTIFFPVYPVYNLIYQGILEKDKIKLSKSIGLLKMNLKNLNPDLIVLHEDGNIKGRSLALASSELNIPIVTIQDGIFSSTNKLTYGFKSDYMFVWGQYFKDMYLDQNIKDHEHVKILGYPYNLKKFEVKKNKDIKTVLYFGQNHEDFNIDFLDSKINTIKNLSILCDKLGYKFIYRPHPHENRDYIKSKVENIKFTKKSDSLINSIKKGDIFISFDSTASIEANLHSKISIQLKNFNLKTDNFENIGACCKTCKNFEELEYYLKEVSESKNLSKYFKPVSPNYFELSSTPGIRFLELVKELI